MMMIKKLIFAILLSFLFFCSEGQNNFFWSHTGILHSLCDEVVDYRGEGSSYPTTIKIDLGTSTGEVQLAYKPFDIPDRFIVEWNGSIVIDTEYVGNSDYDYGGSKRDSFNNALDGRQDPVIGWFYPNTTYWPDDGYPRVTEVPYYDYSYMSFTKNSSESIATVNIYAPMEGTAWEFKLTCPQ